jgi:hypothetical protein
MWDKAEIALGKIKVKTNIKSDTCTLLWTGDNNTLD